MAGTYMYRNPSNSSTVDLIDLLCILDPYKKNKNNNKKNIVAVFAGKICFAFYTSVHFSISYH